MTALPTDADIAALGARAETMLRRLGRISATPDRLVRLYLTPEHRAAADLVADWMREAGLSVSEDALGTVRGRLEAASAGEDRRNAVRRLLIGSHIDTVIDAGIYDGPLGVVAGILTAGWFAERGGLPIALDVLAFGDEEGSRFPTTLTSSLAIAGALPPGQLDVVDRDGVSLRAALAAFGKDPAAIEEAAYPADETAAYVEVHIEQGPVLESLDEPLGIVTAIIGCTRLKIRLDGEAGHAGTVPMALRHDALAGAAEIITAVERIASLTAGSDNTVGTVGRLQCEPGAVNVVPGRVTFTVDLRSLTDQVRASAIAAIGAEAKSVAMRRGLGLAIETTYEMATTGMDAGLQAALGRAIGAQGGRPIALPSGAGHDAQAMARLCPSAMLFVRCKGGISHNPAEYASPADMGCAIAALIRFTAGAALDLSQGRAIR
jgi:allantoate deiminase